jgi:23S rRNA pseudouridine2605 synthase
MTDNNKPDQQGERLQRVLSQRGVASRRASEQLITEGRVQVNGEVVTELGTRVHPTKDRITVDGKVIGRQKPRYLVLNKPPGFITTTSDERSRWTVMDLISVQERVYPIGRLDRETQGLLLFTNDGEVANRVMHPRYRLSKEYHVITERRPSDGQLQELREGILIDETLVVPDEVRLMRETAEGIIIRLVLHEGMFHVVRRMMDKVRIDVVKLRRHRIGPISVTGIPLGAWRDLTPGELEQLFEAIGLSTEDANTANTRRPMQLEPVGGYSPPPRIRQPKRYAEVARHRENLESSESRPKRRIAARPTRDRDGDPREGSGFGTSTSPGKRAAISTRRGTSGKTRSQPSHRNRRSGGSR